jgi:hypothetical protein
VIQVSGAALTEARFRTFLRTGAGGGSGGPPNPWVQGNCGTIATGFQTHAPSRENNGEPLEAADLETGVSDGVDFIEVYEQDVLEGLAGRTNGNVADQTIEEALETAHTGLLANPGCDPLTLSATPDFATVGTAATVTATLGPSATSCPTIMGACPNLLNDLNFLAYTFNPVQPRNAGQPVRFQGVHQHLRRHATARRMQHRHELLTHRHAAARLGELHR